MLDKITAFFKKYFFVISILFFSSILRWVLILKGGQFYFPDENRYGIAQDTIALLLAEKIKTALLTLLGELAHVGFKITALFPAFLENKFGTTLALPAIFFSFFSILSLLLIWKIALRASGQIRVANYALFIAACSQVLLYYSRHLFPYDEAMFFGLFALYVALKNNVSPSTFYWCGVISFLCLVSYNGYWPIAGFAMIVNLFYGKREEYWLLKRPAILGLGFFTPLVILLGVCFMVGKDFFSDYQVYLQKIVQGSFNEGWSLPFEYFWHAEHLFIVIVGLLAFTALFLFLKQRNKFPFKKNALDIGENDFRINSKYLSVALGGTLFIYLCLIIPSNLTHTFVVYARTARQLMPFLALSAAYGLYYLRSWKFGGRWLANTVIVVLFVQAAWNYRLEYNIVYPRQFLQEIQERYPDFKVSSKMMRFYAPLVCQNSGLLVVNFHYIYDWSQPLPSVRGDVLGRTPHPINFLPYQYDGYTPEQRQAILKENFEMIAYKPEISYLTSINNEIENCSQDK